MTRLHLVPEHFASVLLVEDDKDIRDAMSALLESEGYTVLTAGNGEEALRILDRGQPCVVLLDLMMPVMSGAELLEVVRQDAALARVPIVVVSAWPEEASRLNGTCAFVKKPIDLAELLSVVAQP